MARASISPPTVPAGRRSTRWRPAAARPAVSFQGQNNAEASVSYDGKQIAMVQGNGNVYRIVVMDRSLGDLVRTLLAGLI